MFVKLKKYGGFEENRLERGGLLPTDSTMVLNPFAMNQLPVLSPTMGKVRNINLPEMLPSIDNKNRRQYTVEPKKRGAIEIYENGREVRDKRVRDASLKLKIKIASNNSDGKTGTTLAQSNVSPIRLRSRNNLDAIGKRLNKSLDTDIPRYDTIENSGLLCNKDEIYKPRNIPVVVEIKNVLLKSRQEEYNENIYDSLLDHTKTELFSEVKKYINSKTKDIERQNTFSKILVNGLYCSKFINKKECIYTPQKIYLPKNEVFSN